MYHLRRSKTPRAKWCWQETATSGPGSVEQPARHCKTLFILVLFMGIAWNCWKRHVNIASLEGVSDRQWVSAQIEGTIPDPVGSTGVRRSAVRIARKVGSFVFTSAHETGVFAIVTCLGDGSDVYKWARSSNDWWLLASYWHLIGILESQNLKCFLMLEIVGSS